MNGFRGWLWLGLLTQACSSHPTFPPSELSRIDCDERVEDWRVSGEKHCPRLVQAVDGCYVLEVKYSEEFVRLHGGPSRLWGISPLAAAIDTMSRTESTHYGTDYVLFALQLHRQHSYYVTATFDGDQFMPRIVETNPASERTREILPARSLQELDECKAHGPTISADEQGVCLAPAQAGPERW